MNRRKKGPRPFLFAISLFLSLILTGRPHPGQASQDQELLLIAQKAFEDGFYDVAMRYIQQFLETYPQSEKRLQARLLLGQCYFFKNQYLKAFEIFKELKSYADSQDAILYWLGETYFKGSDYKQAEAHYQQLIELYPQSDYMPQAYYSLAWTHWELKQYTQAKEAFLKVMHQFPAHPLSEDASFKVGECDFNLKAYPSAIAFFSDYTKKYPESSRHAESYFYMAEAYFYLEELSNAIQYYTQAAEITSDMNLLSLCQISLGWCYIKQEKFDRAQEALLKARALMEKRGGVSDEILLAEATLYTEKSEYDQSLKAFTQLIEHFPQSPRVAEARLGRAHIYYLKKAYSEAIDEYILLLADSDSLKQRPQIQEKAYYGMAWTYLKKGEIDQSIRTFEKIMLMTDNKIVKVSALTQIGDAYHESEQYEKALSIYDRILKEYPDSLYADYVQYRQGITLLKREQFEAATLSFQSLKNNYPQSQYLPDVPYYLAVAYFRKGDWIAAKTHILDFLQNDSQSPALVPEGSYILALSHFNLAEYKEAIDAFQNLLKDQIPDKTLERNVAMGLAKAYYQGGDSKEALKRFKEIVKNFSKTEIAQESLIWLGNHYLETADYEQAIHYYDQFLQEYPHSAQAGIVHFQLGQTFEVQGKYDQAIYHYKSIPEANDKELFIKARLAIADLFARDMDPAQAIETYQNIATHSPEFIRDCYVKMAEVYEKMRNFPQTIESYAQALSASRGLSDIKNVELQFYIADAYEMLADYDKALEEYLKIPYLYAQEIPWVIKAYLRIARIFEDKEKWEEAKKIYHKVINYQTDELIFAQERLDWIQTHTIE